MDALLAPAWIVALATAGFMGAMAVVKIKGGNGGNGDSRETARALQAVTVTLTALAERLQQLPTREELKDVAQQSRHDFRNITQAAQGTIEASVQRVEQNLTRLIERTAE